MRSRVVSVAAFAYYVMGVLSAAGAMPWMFDEDPLELWPRIGLGLVSVACIAVGALLRTKSPGRRATQLWILGLGIGAAILASVVAEPWVALALVFLCALAVGAVHANPPDISREGKS